MVTLENKEAHFLDGFNAPHPCAHPKSNEAYNLFILTYAHQANYFIENGFHTKFAMDLTPKKLADILKTFLSRLVNSSKFLEKLEKNTKFVLFLPAVLTSPEIDESFNFMDRHTTGNNPVFKDFNTEIIDIYIAEVFDANNEKKQNDINQDENSLFLNLSQTVQYCLSYTIDENILNTAYLVGNTVVPLYNKPIEKKKWYKKAPQFISPCEIISGHPLIHFESHITCDYNWYTLMPVKKKIKLQILIDNCFETIKANQSFTLKKANSSQLQQKITNLKILKYRNIFRISNSPNV